jgi:futalosine hydrolase
VKYGEQVDLAILGAVDKETEPFLTLLDSPREFRFHGSRFHSGRVGRHLVLLGATGLGKVNAALITAALAERFGIVRIWNIGCAGAYADGPLRVGDVLISSEVFCGDEGVLTRQGTESTREIGIPIMARRGRAYYDSISLAGQTMFRAIRRLMPEGRYQEFKLVYGPSLTVSMASGDPETALARYRRYAAHAENMEGSAVVQTCFRFGIPVVECRGISNMAGDRSKDHWEIERAMKNCSGVFETLIDSLSSESTEPVIVHRKDAKSGKGRGETIS